jgi:histone deacetylase 1/2
VNHTFELWGKIVSYFQKQLRAKARQLCVELRATTLENSTVQEYLLRIRLIIDNLASIGDHIPLNQHLDVILEGLPPDFNSVISVVESRFDSIDMDEVEALLLAHEARLQKSKKKTIDDVASINLAQQSTTETTPPDQALALQPSINNSQGTNSNYHPYYGAMRGRGGRNGRAKGRAMGGRTNNNGNVQCQICFKGNHTAIDCWHRHNQQYQGQNPQNNQNFPQAPPHLRVTFKKLMVHSQGRISLQVLENTMVIPFLLNTCGQLWILGSNLQVLILHLLQCLLTHQTLMLLMLGTQTQVHLIM